MLQKKKEERIIFKTPPPMQKCVTILTVRFSESHNKQRRTTCVRGRADEGPAAKNGGGGREVGR